MPNFEQSTGAQAPENEENKADSGKEISNLIDDEMERFQKEDELQKEQSERNKRASEDIAFSIEEELGGMNDEDGSEKIEISADKKIYRSSKKKNKELTGIIEHNAEQIIDKNLSENIDNALFLIDSPKNVQTLLLQETLERVEGEIIKNKTLELAKTNEVAAGVVEYLKSQIENIVRRVTLAELSKRMDSTEDPGMISKYNKLIEAIEGDN